MASATDIIRHEILYQEGGFWKDAGMEILRPVFDKFLKYKVFITFTMQGWYRYIQGMCIFGNMPKSENMLRINNPRNLNRIRFYIKDAFAIAGPFDFRQYVDGQ